MVYFGLTLAIDLDVLPTLWLRLERLIHWTHIAGQKDAGYLWQLPTRSDPAGPLLDLLSNVYNCMHGAKAFINLAFSESASHCRIWSKGVLFLHIYVDSVQLTSYSTVTGDPTCTTYAYLDPK